MFGKDAPSNFDLLYGVDLDNNQIGGCREIEAATTEDGVDVRQEAVFQDIRSPFSDRIANYEKIFSFLSLLLSEQTYFANCILKMKMLISRKIIDLSTDGKL